jgi:hypothetical protein
LVYLKACSLQDATARDAEWDKQIFERFDQMVRSERLEAGRYLIHLLRSVAQCVWLSAVASSSSNLHKNTHCFTQEQSRHGTVHAINATANMQAALHIKPKQLPLRSVCTPGHQQW